MPETSRPSWQDSALVQLTLVRFKEFVREPEAVFWTFLFPIVLAIGLGIAFRNKPADVGQFRDDDGSVGVAFTNGVRGVIPSRNIAPIGERSTANLRTAFEKMAG